MDRGVRWATVPLAVFCHIGFGGWVARLERGEDLNASPKWLNIIWACMSTRAPPAGTVCVGLSAQLCSNWTCFNCFWKFFTFCSCAARGRQAQFFWTLSVWGSSMDHKHMHPSHTGYGWLLATCREGISARGTWKPTRHLKTVHQNDP